MKSWQEKTARQLSPSDRRSVNCNRNHSSSLKWLTKRYSTPLSQYPVSSSRGERTLGTSPDLLTRDYVHCRWRQRGKEEPRLQVPSKAGALGKIRKRRRKKAKLFNSPSTITAVQELSSEKYSLLVSLNNEFLPGCGSRKQHIQEEFVSSEDVVTGAVITYDDINHSCFVKIFVPKMPREKVSALLFPRYAHVPTL